jgi:D-alanyl-D-alanine carboxypeptidase
MSKVDHLVATLFSNRTPIMKKSLGVNYLAFVLILGNSLSCSQSSLPLSQQLQQALENGARKHDGMGISAAAVLPNGETWLGVSGKSHDTVAVKPDMLFAIGSITKNVVAALTLQLAAEGKLSLEDSLHKWLPKYPHIDSTIAIRQLLNHTSGLYMFWDNQNIWDDLKKYRTKVFTPEEVLGYLKDPYFSPGKGHRYSNTNYLLMAMIITKATGSTLSAEFRKRFWQPLGLRNTYLSMEEKLPDNLAHVWGDNFEDDGSFKDITFLPRASHESITYGSSGLFMTAEDLARWSQALFQGNVLKQTSLAEMLRFEGAGYYGLGVGRFSRSFANGGTAYGHAGGNIGTIAYMIYLPDFRMSVAVMINRYDTKAARGVTEDLIEILTDYFSFQKVKDVR